MATVTVYTAQHMDQIKNATIVGGSFDAAGHLILTRHDGQTIDAGAMTIAAATEIMKGIVELASNAETIAGTDNTLAVTPAGLAALEASRILPPSTFNNASAAGDYPLGVSYIHLNSTQTTAGSWGFGTAKAGVVVTYRSTDAGGAYQYFYRVTNNTVTPEMWFRAGNSTGWASWQKTGTGDVLVSHIDTVKGQADAPGTYPVGISLMGLNPTTASSGSWSGLIGIFGSSVDGVVYTIRPRSGFGVQYFMRGGLASITPGLAMRTGSDAGWGPWQRTIMYDEYNTALGLMPKRQASGTILVTPVPNTITKGAITFPAGRFTAAPNVQVTAMSSVIGQTLQGVAVDDITTTGCNGVVLRTNDTVTRLYWLATQD